MSQHKWIVDDELVFKKLNKENTLEIKFTEKGLEVRVWEEPKGNYDKRKLLYRSVVSHGQLGYLTPRED